jgi:hypothetical protein
MVDPAAAFLRLVELRVRQAEEATGKKLNVTFDIGEYPHFKKKRGFGVTFIEPEHCHMRYAEKLCYEHLSRADAIIRHELGHVVDGLVNPQKLNSWARTQGFTLADTPEVRADDIAEVIWGTPLRYDKDTVQNTIRGRPARPKHLGS